MRPTDMTDGHWEHLFDVRRSIRYHMRRQAYYERSHRFATATAVILGSATVVGVLQKLTPELVAACAAFVSVISTMDLINGNAQKAWQHADLRRRFIELEKEQLALDMANDSLLPDLQCKRLVIETDEPPVYRALDIMCYNETIRAEGANEEHFHKVPIHKRLTAQWLYW